MTIGKKSKAQVNKLRPGVFERDGNTCIAAGVFGFCGGGLTIQHRVGRGMGGSAQYDTPAHLITMCATHNELQTASASFAEICQSRGWSVPRWAVDRVKVSDIPVSYPGRGWYMLHEDGTVQQVTRFEAVPIFLSLYGQVWGV
jgi:hypothetical protein